MLSNDTVGIRSATRATILIMNLNCLDPKWMHCSYNMSMVDLKEAEAVVFE